MRVLTCRFFVVHCMLKNLSSSSPQFVINWFVDLHWYIINIPIYTKKPLLKLECIHTMYAFTIAVCFNPQHFTYTH